MKILDVVYKCLGFESDDVKVAKRSKTNATYNLKLDQELPDEIDGVKVYYPETLGDCKDKAEYIKRGTPFILDFRNCSMSEKNRILGYFAGVVDMLGAKIENLDKNIFIFLPKNFEIELT